MEQKQLIIETYEQTIEWVKSLLKLSEGQWRMPVAEGKWTIAEVIGHLIPWDTFVLEQRLPYFFTEQTLPAGPEVERINGLASEKSKLKTKEELIASFVAGRTELIAELKAIPNENWQYELPFRKRGMTLWNYFYNLLEHDERHFAEIRNALDKCSKKGTGPCYYH